MDLIQLFVIDELSHIDDLPSRTLFTNSYRALIRITYCPYTDNWREQQYYCLKLLTGYTEM